MSDHEQTLRKMHHDGAHGIGDYTSIGPEEAAACLSGADALVRAKQTCGNCRYNRPSEDNSRRVCSNQDSIAHNAFRLSADDACRKGWATREAE